MMVMDDGDDVRKIKSGLDGGWISRARALIDGCEAGGSPLPPAPRGGRKRAARIGKQRSLSAIVVRRAPARRWIGPGGLWEPPLAPPARPAFPASCFRHHTRRPEAHALGTQETVLCREQPPGRKKCALLAMCLARSGRGPHIIYSFAKHRIPESRISSIAATGKGAGTL